VPTDIEIAMHVRGQKDGKLSGSIYARHALAASFFPGSRRVPRTGAVLSIFNCTHENAVFGMIAVKVCFWEEAAMTRSVFEPELVELMRPVLEEAAAMLPEAKRTSIVKADIASEILACAAKGERDPTVLKSAALSVVMNSPRCSHDISRDRRAV